MVEGLLPMVLGLAVVLLTTAFFLCYRQVMAVFFLFYSPRNDNWLPGVPMIAAAPHWLLGHLKSLKGDPKAPNLIEGMRKLFVENSPSKTGLATFWFFTQKAIVLLSAEHVKTALLSTNQRNAIPLLGRHMRQLLGAKSIALLSTLDPSLWKSHRSVVAEAFRTEHLKQMVGDMALVADKLIQALLNRTNAATEQGQVFEFDLFQVRSSAHTSLRIALHSHEPALTFVSLLLLTGAEDGDDGHHWPHRLRRRL
jgi:cytochrome P450